MTEGVLWFSVSNSRPRQRIRYRQAIDRELAKFERREREIYGAGTARKSGPARLVHFGLRKETATSCHKIEIKVARDHKLAFVTPRLADPRSWPLHVRQPVDF
jgi:hypothetical protein